MTNNTDPQLRRKKALPAAVLALAASTLISACTASETGPRTIPTHAEKHSKEPGPEVTLAVPMMRRLEARILAVYKSKKNNYNYASSRGNYMKYISPGDKESDSVGTTFIHVEDGTAPSGVPGYTGQYSATINVQNNAEGKPKLDDVNFIIVDSSLFSKKMTQDGDFKDLKNPYQLIIHRVGQGYRVNALGLAAPHGPWEATTLTEATPGIKDSWHIGEKADYVAVEKSANEILDNLQHNQPVEYTLNPLP